MRMIHALAILAIAACAGHALEGTAYFIAKCGGPYALYAVDLSDGATRRLLTSSQLSGFTATQADLSPDGRRIALGVSGGGSTHPSIWIANNDGTGLRKLADCPYKNGWAFTAHRGLAFTDAGIYWVPADGDASHDAHDVYVTNAETGATALAYHITDAAEFEMQAMKCSNDGRRHILWAAHDTAMQDAEHATRGPLITLNAAGAVSQTRWFHRYETSAHGYGMSASGDYVYLVAYTSETAAGCAFTGYHSTVVVRRWSDGQIEKCVLRTAPKFLPGNIEPTNSFNMATCRNSEDHFAITVRRVADQCPSWWYIVNWRTEEVTRIAPDTAVFPYSAEDVLGDSVFWCYYRQPCFGFPAWWLGALPSGTSPAIAAAPRSLIFTDAVSPVPPQVVAVTNNGAGTLTTVQAAVSSGAQGWLSAAVSGSGNSQTVTATAATGSLAPGAYQGTIVLSGGGAVNTVNLSVTLNVGVSINAPSDLGAFTAGDSSVTTAWTDNSNNETGFEVEQASDSVGPWQRVATVAANTTTHTRRCTVLGTTYWYRVRAVNGVAQSGYSGKASVFLPIPRRVEIAAPEAGDTLVGGEVCTIRWNVFGGVGLCDLEYTLDDGETWVRPLMGGVPAGPDGTAFYEWTVPAVASAVSVAVVRVWPYGEAAGATGTEVGPLVVVPESTGSASRSPVSPPVPSVTGLRGAPRFILGDGASFTCAIAGGDRAVLRVFSLDGEEVAGLAVPAGPGVHTVVWDGSDRYGRSVGRGCYVARLIVRR